MKLFNKIINNNEACVMLSSNGTKTFVKGPSAVLLPSRFTFDFLKPYTAKKTQYLLIRYLDGNSKIMNGPIVEFLNPLEHSKIEIMENINIAEHETIRVYKPVHGKTDNKENWEHFDISGPCHYTPNVNEKCVRLNTFRAMVGEYLKILHKNGEITVITGPSHVLQDPDEHELVTVQNCVNVNSNEYIRIYKSNCESTNEGKATLSYTDMEGPCYYTPNANEKIVRLVMHRAMVGEYIHIYYKNGTINTINGPHSILQDPDEHEKVSIEKCLSLKSNECVFVYRKNSVVDSTNSVSTQNTTRVRIDGPCYYTPTPNENYHQFSWHGREKKSKDNSVSSGSNVKVPNALEFKILTLIPRQIYIDVPVRTLDDAEITVCFMVFYELQNVEMMLDTTTDPIGDILNAHAADVISFVSKRSFDQFKTDSIGLNDLQHFPQLVKSIGDLGYLLYNVVFKGYITNSKLQKIHEDAIAKRTQLILDREVEKEKQEIEDFKLKKNNERESEENRFKLSKVENELHRNKLEYATKMSNDTKMHELNLLQRKNKYETELHFYEQLQKMGVDLTRVINEKEMSKKKHKVIRIMSDDKAVNLKLSTTE